MSASHRFRYVSTDRRVREDRRFVAGKGRFAADIALGGTRHVALVSCPWPAARIVSIDAAEALAMPGVHAVVTGRELAERVDPILPGVDAPEVKRYPMAVDVARYAGEWVVAVVAESRPQRFEAHAVRHDAAGQRQPKCVEVRKREDHSAWAVASSGSPNPTGRRPRAWLECLLSNLTLPASGPGAGVAGRC